MGSFVSRARFVTHELRHQALLSLATFAAQYLEALSPHSRRPSAPLHGVLYTAVQALVYGICFAYDQYVTDVAEAVNATSRGDADAETAAWPLRPFALEAILLHETNPLKFCSRAVCNEFARLAPSLGLPFVRSLVRHNRRVVLPADAQWPDTTVQHFFPFDPYVLRCSSPYVDRDDIYVHFQAPQIVRTNARSIFAPHFRRPAEWSDDDGREEDEAADFDSDDESDESRESHDESDDDTGTDSHAGSEHVSDSGSVAASRSAGDHYARRHRRHHRHGVRRRSRSPNNSFSPSSGGTPTRELLFGLGHAGSLPKSASMLSQSFEYQH